MAAGLISVGVQEAVSFYRTLRVQVVGHGYARALKECN